MLSARDFAAEAMVAATGEFDEWQDAFQKLLDSSIGCSLTDGELQKMARSFAKPSQIGRWLSVIEDSVESANYFFQTVDGSPYSLKEWVQALSQFDYWLTEHSRSMPFKKRLEYICCCEEFSKLNPAQTTLPEVLQQMLEQHGVAEN